VEGGVGCGRALRRPKVRPQARTRKSDLGDPARVRPQVSELLRRQEALADQPAGDSQRRGPLQYPVTDSLAPMPLPPEKSVDVMLAEASHSLRHLTLEGQPAHLSVGDDAEPRFVLKGDGLVHSPIL